MEHIGMHGRKYEIVKYDHTNDMDLHFKTNGQNYVIPCSNAELSELAYDFSQIVMKLK